MFGISKIADFARKEFFYKPKIVNVLSLQFEAKINLCYVTHFFFNMDVDWWSLEIGIIITAGGKLCKTVHRCWRIGYFCPTEWFAVFVVSRSPGVVNFTMSQPGMWW